MIRHKIKVIHDHCAAVGRDPSEIEITRMGTLMITDSDEQTAQVRDFLSSAAGPEAAAGFNVGQEQEIVDQMAELFEAGVNELIFNMPVSPVADVRRAGELLTKSFA
jgi:alkanesulfonate monooxygenase SsuD/methylene tetrahydromethanopterin reductase-like flavin-dependent oxidoreductase (luciferase family)